MALVQHLIISAQIVYGQIHYQHAVQLPFFLVIFVVTWQPLVFTVPTEAT